MKPSLTFPVLLTRFFSQRLIQQRQASPHTISSYRDTFRLLLQFAKVRLGKEPSRLTWDDIDATLEEMWATHLSAKEAELVVEVMDRVLEANHGIVHPD